MGSTRDRGQDRYRFSIAELGVRLGGGVVSGEAKGKEKVCSQPTCFPPPLFLLKAICLSFERAYFS